jgi:carbon monoxide dehydrogenase subunit G
VRASAEIVVDRPPAAVWAWASDPRHWHEWQDGVTDVSADGDRFTSHYAYGPHSGTAVYEIAERTPPRRQVVRSVSGPFRFEGTLDLSPDVGGTRVRQTVVTGPEDALARFVFAVAGPLVRRSIRRGIARQLARLKTMVELEATL